MHFRILHLKNDQEMIKSLFAF